MDRFFEVIGWDGTAYCTRYVPQAAIGPTSDPSPRLLKRHAKLKQIINVRIVDGVASYGSNGQLIVSF